MQTNKILWIVLATGSVLFGCTKEHAAEKSASTSIGASVGEESGQVNGQAKTGSPNQSNNTGLWITVPERLQFPGLANVEVAPSWNARVSRLSATDQAYLAKVSERYYGAVEFLSEAEQRRLIEQGFPMPEEWLAARHIPDSELERLSKAGNVKAQMFQVDRVGERVAPVLEERGLLNTPADKELFRQFTETTVVAEQLLRDTHSPFAAYLAGRLFSAGTSGNQLEPIAAAFQLARDLGDERADTYRSAFMQQHPNMNAEAVMASYSMLKANVDRK